MHKIINKKGVINIDMIENIVTEREEIIIMFKYLLKQNLITESEYKISIEKIK